MINSESEESNKQKNIVRGTYNPTKSLSFLKLGERTRFYSKLICRNQNLWKAAYVASETWLGKSRPLYYLHWLVSSDGKC